MSTHSPTPTPTLGLDTGRTNCFPVSHSLSLQTLLLKPTSDVCHLEERKKKRKNWVEEGSLASLDAVSPCEGRRRRRRREGEMVMGKVLPFLFFPRPPP